jgi:hypothetical protein
MPEIKGVHNIPMLAHDLHWFATAVLIPRRSVMADTSSNFDPLMAHRVTFEHPDTMRVTLVGSLTAAQGAAMIARIHELGREHGPMFWLIDVSRFAMSGERVRDVFLKGGSERYPIYAGVMFGASFPVRVAMMMALTAGARIIPNSFSFPFEFTATEDQACSWIASKRAAMMTPRRTGDFLATGG